MNFEEEGSSGLAMNELLPSLSCGAEVFLSGKSMEVSDASLRQISPAALAYLGDAVYELHTRLNFLLPPKRIQLYHNQVVAEVRAEAQANHLKLLQPYLTTHEIEVLKRGRNASPRGPKRLDPEIYQQATSLETLLGYLYLADPERLTELLHHISFKSKQTIVN
jgi:ribonuclease III family protein